METVPKFKSRPPQKLSRLSYVSGFLGCGGFGNSESQLLSLPLEMLDL